MEKKTKTCRQCSHRERWQLEAEKQALIDKACEWWEDNAINDVDKDNIAAWRSAFAAFRKAMKGEQFKAEKQALIDKACEWWDDEFTLPEMTQDDISYKESLIEEFRQAMKGGEQ